MLVPPALQDYATAALAGLIADRRQQAISDGVRPLPGAITRAMLGFFPDALLRKCRYAIGDGRKLTLASIRLTYGDAAAVTLGDVVLFTDDRAAQSDLKLWARELTRVMQYQRWGIEDFAARYVRDPASVEREVTANTARFLDWYRERQAAIRA